MSQKSKSAIDFFNTDGELREEAGEFDLEIGSWPLNRIHRDFRI